MTTLTCSSTWPKALLLIPDLVSVPSLQSFPFLFLPLHATPKKTYRRGDFNLNADVLKARDLNLSVELDNCIIWKRDLLLTLRPKSIYKTHISIGPHLLYSHLYLCIPLSVFVFVKSFFFILPWPCGPLKSLCLRSCPPKPLPIDSVNLINLLCSMCVVLPLCLFPLSGLLLILGYFAMFHVRLSSTHINTHSQGLKPPEVEHFFPGHSQDNMECLSHIQTLTQAFEKLYIK